MCFKVTRASASIRHGGVNPATPKSESSTAAHWPLSFELAKAILIGGPVVIFMLSGSPVFLIPLAMGLLIYVVIYNGVARVRATRKDRTRTV